MRKSGWAAATGLGSLVLLLAACSGGSSSSSAAATGAATRTAQATSAPATQATSAKASSSKSSKTSKTSSVSSSSPAKPVPHHTAGPQPSSGTVTFPSQGTTIMVVQKSAVGYVLAEANGQVVYTYSKDKKGGAPTCTGSCAGTFSAATGAPQAGPADTFPGSFGVVKGAGGVEQITYEGYPLYTYKDATAYAVSGNGHDGEWHVITLSAGDVSGG